MDTHQDQAHETEYAPRYRRYSSAPPDFPQLRGPRGRVRRDAPLPPYRYHRSQLSHPTRAALLQDSIAVYLALVRVLEVPIQSAWHYICLGWLWHSVNVVPLLGVIRVLLERMYRWIVDHHTQHWRRYCALTVLLYGFLFCSANMEYHMRFTRAAMKPPAYDSFHPDCPPTFMAATCPEILRVPPRIYPRLLEPAGSMDSYYRHMMKCWHPRKLFLHSAVDESFAKDVRAVLEECQHRMGLGDRYPRAIWSADYKERIEIDETGLWNANTLDSVNNTLAFPQSTKACGCDMDMAVGNLWRSSFIPPWASFYTTKKPLPRTLAQLVDYCACDIQTAWAPFQHVFNISIAPPRILRYTILSGLIGTKVEFPQDIQIALSWLALKYSFKSLLFYPVSLIFYLFFPVPTIQSFHDLHLPPRGAHHFWFDSSLRGLPTDSMSNIGVPDTWTEQLRHYGMDGTIRFGQMMARRKSWSARERRACERKGWCFKGEV